MSGRLMRTVRHPGTWLGLGSTLLLMATSWSGDCPDEWRAFAPIAAWRHLVTFRAGGLLSMLATALLGLAFLLLRPSRRDGGAVAMRLVLVLWSLPLIVAMPVLTTDLWAYSDIGYQVATGQNPYQVGLGDGGGPFARWVYELWRHTPAVYPAPSLQVMRAMVELGHRSLVWSLLAARLPAVAGVALLAAFLPALARHFGFAPSRVLWLGTLNPIVIAHLIGGGHNDAAMIGLAAGAFWLATKRLGLITGALLAGLATGMKQPGLLAAAVVGLIAVPTGRWWRRLGAAALSTAIGLVAFVVLSAATRIGGLGLGWIGAVSVPTSVFSSSLPMVLSMILALATFYYPLDIMIKVCYVLMALTFCWVAWRSRLNPMVVAVGGWLAYTVFGGSLHSWYPAVAFAFVGLVKLRPAWQALVFWFAVYCTLEGTWFAITTNSFLIQPSFCALAATAMTMLWYWWLRPRLNAGGTPGIVAEPVAAIE